jgi:hypothetical protein
MTKLDDVSGNPARSEAILAVVREAVTEGDTSYEAVAAKIVQRIRDARLNITFDELSVEEVAVALEMLQPAEFNADEPAVEQIPEAELLAGLDPASVTVTESVEPAMSRDDANAELQRRRDALHTARRARMIAENDQRLARERMAQALLEWNTGAPTADQIRRREIAAINADRGAKVERSNQRQPGTSYIDRSRFYSAGGNASDFVRTRPPLTEAEARKIGGHGPGTKGHARGASRMQQGPAKLHGER